MRRALPETIDELRNRNLSVHCPGCADTVTLNPVAGPINSFDYAYFIGRCPNSDRRHCRPIFGIYQPLNDIITERYPIPSFEARWIHEAVPLSIREDYAEAKRCTFVKAYKGAVAMYRRVVEATHATSSAPTREIPPGGPRS
jgi:hypothetical protein